MRDLDIDRNKRLTAEQDDRSLRICGQTLTARASVRPEAWVRYWDDRKRVDELTNTEYLALLDETIEAVVEPESVTVWQALRADERDAVSLADIGVVLDALWEIQTARPFEPDSGSSSTPEPSGTPSTEDSPSPEATSTE